MRSPQPGGCIRPDTIRLPFRQLGIIERRDCLRPAGALNEPKWITALCDRGIATNRVVLTDRRLLARNIFPGGRYIPGNQPGSGPAVRSA